MCIIAYHFANIPATCQTQQEGIHEVFACAFGGRLYAEHANVFSRIIPGYDIRPCANTHILHDVWFEYDRQYSLTYIKF